MNKIIKILMIATLALVVALCVGCGKKDSSDKKDNVSSNIRTDGFLNEIFGDDFDDGDDSSNKTHEDIVDAGALDALEGQGSSSGTSSGGTTSSKDDGSKDTSTTSSKDNDSKDSSSSKESSSSSSSSKNESSSKNDSSSSKNQTSSATSSKNNVSTDNDSTIYTPGWI